MGYFCPSSLQRPSERDWFCSVVPRSLGLNGRWFPEAERVGREKAWVGHSHGTGQWPRKEAKQRYGAAEEDGEDAKPGNGMPVLSRPITSPTRM